MSCYLRLCRVSIKTILALFLVRGALYFVSGLMRGTSKGKGTKGEKMKKIIGFVLSLAIFSILSVPAFAQGFDISTQPTSGDGDIQLAASWGHIKLKSDPEFAYATMSTFAGKAYYLSAEVTGFDELGSIPSSTNYAFNASSTTTGKIFKRSGSVTWTGYGTIQDTKTSGTQYATISKSY